MAVLINNNKYKLKINNKNNHILINNEEIIDYTVWIIPDKVKYGDEAFVFTVDLPTNSFNMNILHGVNPSTGAANAPYNWIIEWGDGIIETKSGISTNALTPNYLSHTYLTSGKYTIIIKPVVNDYQWIRAFASTTSTDIKDIISFDYVTNKGFMESCTSYGIYYMAVSFGRTKITYPANECKTVNEDNITNIDDYFKHNKYMETNLIIPEKEWLPSNITSIGNWFRNSQYAITKLQYSVEEYMPNSVTTVGNNFRNNQYSNCLNLIGTPSIEILPDSVTTIGTNFRNGQYVNCPNILIGDHIHIRMDEFLNIGYISGTVTYYRNYYYMFCLASINNTPDTLPKYKDKLGNIYPISNLIPLLSTAFSNNNRFYCTNRTGIPEYASLHANWK